MGRAFDERVRNELSGIERDGLWRSERILSSRQGVRVRVVGPSPADVLNFCANNYLGLASDERVIEAAVDALVRWGAGLASVRFICGTQSIHKELEEAIARYVGQEAAILFPAAFDANGGLFEPLLGEGDWIISDSLNHASIIDGARLSKATRKRFANGDMEALEDVLRQARTANARTILIATDGVFSMDGHVADLPAITALADRYDGIVMVDDCHATGIVGPSGRGTGAHHGVAERIDIVTGTFGKALGGAMGGFVAAAQPVVELLRQRARPYLFSNSLSPSVCGAALAAIAIAESGEGDRLRADLERNSRRFRQGLVRLGFDLVSGEHPIIPVMLGDARLAEAMAARLLDRDVYLTAFSYPVVPRGEARIRVQMSAAHCDDHIDRALSAFSEVGRELGAIE